MPKYEKVKVFLSCRCKKVLTADPNEQPFYPRPRSQRIRRDQSSLLTEEPATVQTSF